MSNETKWTPGPWVASRANGSMEIGVLSRADDQSCGMMLVICTVDEYDHPEHGENARLIAAAPELYEALEKAVTSMQDSGYSNSHITVRAGNAALAKARGETDAH